MTHDNIAKTENAANRRYAPRYAFRLLSQGIVQADSFEVCLQSISITGASIEAPVELAVGSRVELVLPGAGSTLATVVWSDGQFSGCLFDTPISRATLSAARLKGGPVTADDASEAAELPADLLLSEPQRLPGAWRLGIAVGAALGTWGLIAGAVFLAR